jgi:TonB family protein
VIFAPRDTHNAGVEDGEASTAKLRRFLGVLIPLIAIGYIASVAFDFDARWPNGITIGDAVNDAGLIVGVDRKTAVTTLTSYESGTRCVRFLPRAQSQMARLGAKQGAVYDVGVTLIPKIGRDLCNTSPIPFGRFYEIVSVERAAVIACAPDVFIARGRQCALPEVNPAALELPPVITTPAPPIETPTNDIDPPPAVPYRPFGAEPPPPVQGLDGDNVSFEDFYPPSAIRLEQEGVVRVRVTHVANRGSISCTVLESSGYSALDRQTCRLVGNHRLFTPSITNAGVRSNVDIRNGEATIVQGVRWVLPK